MKIGPMLYDIFVNCNWVVTRGQQYSTHLHTNSTQNDTIDTKQYTEQHNTQNNTINTNNTQNNTIQ